MNKKVDSEGKYQMVSQSRIRYLISVVTLTLINVVFVYLFILLIDFLVENGIWNLDTNSILKFQFTVLSKLISTIITLLISKPVIKALFIHNIDTNLNPAVNTKNIQDLSISPKKGQKYSLKDEIQKDLKMEKKSKSSNINFSEINFFKPFLKGNFLRNFGIGIIIFLIFYVPIDLIGNIIPGMMEFSGESVLSDNMENYFIQNFGKMILDTSIIHFLIASREEMIYRNFFLQINKPELSRGMLMTFSSFLFGMAHFNYIFKYLIGPSDPLTFRIFLFCIWWGIAGFLIASFTSSYFLKTGKFWPVIVSHSLNNIIAAIAIRWQFLGIDFYQTTLVYLYIPLISLGLILGLIYRKPIKDLLIYWRKLFYEYYIELKENNLWGLDISIVLILYFGTTLLSL